MYGRRRLTRVEMAIYALIVAVLLLVFAKYVLDYMEMAEKTAMETTVTNVTVGLNLRYAAAVMAGQPVNPKQWMAQNPFELAKAFPPGYAGELSAAASEPASRPAWFFDTARKQVVYLPRLHSHLEVEDGSEEIRFRLRPHPSGFGFALVPARSYSWTLETDG